MADNSLFSLRIDLIQQKRKNHIKCSGGLSLGKNRCFTAMKKNATRSFAFGGDLQQPPLFYPMPLVLLSVAVGMNPIAPSKNPIMKTILTLIGMCVLGCQLQAQVSFDLSSSPAVGLAPVSVAAADVNGDGKVDLISANSQANTLTVLTNNGSGGFVLSGTYAVGITLSQSWLRMSTGMAGWI
jgi:hypothetical protein